MKSSRLFLICTLAITTSGSALAQTEIITFDDLDPATLPGGDAVYEAPIPNGYGGLQWNNFWVLNVPLQSVASGYQQGLISPNNLAFNNRANPAMFSDGLFNLNSAYLTAAWNDGLHVEVQGFVGAMMVYDNTYIVNTTGPTFVNFNYLGVNAVNFISSGGVPHGYAGVGTHFAMDNMSITLVPEPSAIALTGLVVLVLAAPRRQTSTT
jgi:hypothetical protein